MQVLVSEISHIENVKENIVNILDDVMLYTSYIGDDLQSEKKVKK